MGLIPAIWLTQPTSAPRDYAEGVRWYRKAADQGDADAQLMLGILYNEGIGVPRDYAEAIRWYRKAADQGNAGAQIRLTSMYENGQGVPKDAAEAVKWRRKAAEHGNADAQAKLGLMYADGLGVPKNLTEAFRWYRNAAEQGHAGAQGAVGAMYYKGLGVPKNLAGAFRWIRKAAAQENPQAQALLGFMYQLGEGVPRDYIQAYMWYNLAATGGVNRAAQDRDGLEHAMAAAQIAEAQQRTATWRPVQPEEQQTLPGKSDDPWAAANPQPMPKTAKPAPEAASGQLGTGFFIGEGLLLTNAHVVKGCLEASIGPPGQRVTALVVARDDDNDLALLRAATHPPAVAVLRLSVRQGEAIAAYGYPLPGLFASGGNLTTGNITALSGIGDDSRFLQISAPVQPGNRGGPLLDGAGNVVGIVEGKLNATKVASAIGDVPQNVNFAIKASVVATFLDSNGIHYDSGVSASVRPPADIAENARHFTVPVECSGSAQ
ncbi:MAG: tetratricopeptide repeat-containing serine protease family protein [Methylocella sp.]